MCFATRGEEVMSLPVSEVGSFNPGQQVQQTELFGLAYLSFNPFVIEVVNGRLHLSATKDGPPLTNIYGEPRDFPAFKFRVLH